MFDKDEGLIKRLKMANFNLIYHLFYKSTPPLKVELILGIVQISQFFAFSLSSLVNIKIILK